MLTNIRLQNYRSYKDESFEFNSGVNIIVGPNASGKTNLLESILINCGESSYRGKDIELISYNSEWAKIDCHTKEDIDRTTKLVKNADNLDKTYVIGGQELKRISLQKTIPAVLFEPNHLNILTDSPDSRRNFLDDLLEKIVPGFKETRKQYRRVLYQRNTLLKTGYSNANKNIFVWNLRLSDLGENIYSHRIKLIELINKSATEIYNSLAQKKYKIEFNYVTKINPKNYSSNLIKKLEDSIQTDCERGFTSYGPHRDDFSVLINNHEAEESASRGEMRTLMLVCKVIEMRIIEESRGIKPIILLDDVFSELDGSRRKALTSFLNDYQSFITTTDADIILHHFTDKANIIALSS